MARQIFEKKRRFVLIAAIIVGTTALTPGAASGFEPPGPAIEQARTLFQTGKYAEALESLDALAEAKPAPTGLDAVKIALGRHKLVLELKVAPKITAKHRQQLQRYVRARISTGMNVEGAAVICWTDRNTMEFYEMDIPCRSRYFAAPSQ